MALTEETGSPQPLQPEVIPLPSTPTSTSHLQIPNSPSSPARPTHVSTPSSSSASTAGSSSRHNRPIPQPLMLPSSPPMGSQLSAVASVSPFAHQSDLPSIAARRANTGMKSGRELLLPIGVGSRSSEMGSPTSPTRMRTSLDKVLRRDGAASTTEINPASPASGSLRFGPVSPRQARFAHNHMDSNVNNSNDGSLPPRSPHSIRSHRSASSLVPPSPSRSAIIIPSLASPSRSEHSPSSPQRPEHKQLANQPSTASLTASLALRPRLTPSKHPFFSHPPPDAQPFVPHISEKTGKPQRNYETHPSRNRFFLNGRILTGGDAPIPFILSFSLVLSIAGTWFGTTAVWWWHNESPAVAIVGAYLCLLTISSMLATVSTSLPFSLKCCCCVFNDYNPSRPCEILASYLEI